MTEVGFKNVRPMFKISYLWIVHKYFFGRIKILIDFFHPFRIEEELGPNAVYAGEKFRHPLK